MKSLKHYLFLAAMLLIGATIASCTPEEEQKPEVKVPAVQITAGEVTDSTLSFTVLPENAENVRYSYYEKTADFVVPAYSDIIANGTEIDATKQTVQTIKDLKAETLYVIVVAAYGSELTVGKTLEMTTAEEPVKEPEVLDITFEAADYAFVLDAGEVQYIYFSNEDYELSIKFNTTDPIAAGTYTASLETVANTFSKESALFIAGIEAPYNIKEGTIIVEGNTDNFNFTFDLVLNDELGTIVKATYEGVVEGMVDPNLDQSLFINAKYEGTVETEALDIVFYRADGDCFHMPIFPYEGYEGTYTVAANYEVGEIDYMNAGFDGGGYPDFGNTVTITKQDKYWRVEFNITDMEKADPLVGTYVGPIVDLP